MEKIYFDRLRWKNPWNVLPVLAFFFIFLSIGGYYYWAFESKILNIFLLAIHSLLVLYFSRLYWYKNTIQWNRKACVIRIKPYRFIGKTLYYNQIKSIQKKENVLYATLLDNKMIHFDLTQIRIADQNRLFHLLQTHLAP